MRRFSVKWIIVAVAVVAIAGLGYWGVRAMIGGPAKGQLYMAVRPVTRGDIEVTVRGWGQLQATEERDVVSSAEGVVKDVFFEVGQNVSKGQILASIDLGSLSVKLKTAEIQLEAKKVELARSFGVSLDEVTTVDPAIALTVRAPIAGRITGLTAAVGGKPAGEICRVVDDGRLLFKTELGLSLFETVNVGTKVMFRAERFEGGTEGVVTRCDPNPIKGDAAYYYAVWAELPNPGLLKVGDEGILVFYGSGGEFQQKVKIDSFGVEESVTPAVSGKVKAIYARDGMVVEEGDPILEFESGEALLTAMTLQLEAKKLEIEVDDYRTQMANKDIVSPIDGMVVSRGIASGQQVGVGFQVCRVSNFTNMKLLLMVDEMDVPKVQEGQIATVFIWGPEGRQDLQAEVSALGAIGDPRDGMASFDVTLAVVNPGFLRPGMYGDAEIFVSRKEAEVPQNL